MLQKTKASEKTFKHISTSHHSRDCVDYNNHVKAIGLIVKFRNALKQLFIAAIFTLCTWALLCVKVATGSLMWLHGRVCADDRIVSGQQFGKSAATAQRVQSLAAMLFMSMSGRLQYVQYVFLHFVGLRNRILCQRHRKRSCFVI